jgi:hypothetical protein
VGNLLGGLFPAVALAVGVLGPGGRRQSGQEKKGRQYGVGGHEEPAKEFEKTSAGNAGIVYRIASKSHRH